MNVYITTAIDYPNALPHIGTAFEKIGADAYARWKRFQGCNVYFLMGNDENTAKVAIAAKDRDIQEYVDEKAAEFKKVWAALDISYDHFLQTSSQKHADGVQYFLTVLKQAGYIEKRSYASLYCNGCEEFKTESTLVTKDGLLTCPNHLNQPLITRFEENYFFCLSKFQNKLKRNLEHDLLLQPESRFNEIKQFLEQDLQDVSISRQVTIGPEGNQGWGIAIPWDNTQIVYVWFDALLSYLTGVGFGHNQDLFDKFWPAEVHFIGKDIVRFHSTLFPAMIMAYNELAKPIELPKEIFGHGFIQQKNDRGEIVKSSKSGDAINPMDLVAQYGSDAVRYSFLNRDFGADSEFNFSHFRNMYNADLANGIGNLTSRVVSMIQKFCDGEILNESYPGHKLICYPVLDRLRIFEFCRRMDQYDFQGAIKMIHEIVIACNQEIDLQELWKMEDKVKQRHVLRWLAVNLKLIGLLLTPFLPKTAKKIYNCFEWGDEPSMGAIFTLVDGFQGQVKLRAGDFPPLFPRVA